MLPVKWNRKHDYKLIRLQAFCLAEKSRGRNWQRCRADKQCIGEKSEVIKSIELHKPDKNDIFDVISKVGGYDIAALTGAFIGGAMYGAAMVIDGFISSVAALCAEKLCPKCSDFMIASHVSKESCTADILKILGKKAPINADMCLGEGTGGMVMLTALDTALCVYNEMSTFDDINVESYKELK